MLSASEQSDDEVFRQIVGATAAVIFLGTPHRGSLDLVHLGNMGRAVVGALGFDTTTAVLDALGLKTSDLERSQESFSRLWRKYDFEVKTFQESLGLSGANIGPLNDQVRQLTDISQRHDRRRRHLGLLLIPSISGRSRLFVPAR